MENFQSSVMVCDVSLPSSALRMGGGGVVEGIASGKGWPMSLC